MDAITAFTYNIYGVFGIDRWAGVLAFFGFRPEQASFRVYKRADLSGAESVLLGLDATFHMPAVTSSQTLAQEPAANQGGAANFVVKPSGADDVGAVEVTVARYLVVQDAVGLTYRMVELVGSASGVTLAFYAFDGAVPASGTSLSVVEATDAQPFESADEAAFAVIAAQGLTGTAIGETLTGNENAETIEGLAGNDLLLGLGGNDTLDGGLGDDSLDGGSGIDTLSFASLSGSGDLIPGFGVFVDLAAQGVPQTTGAGTDTFVNFENLAGSDFADLLQGDDAANVIEGLGGSDLLQGAGGDDTLFGGAGFDVVEGGPGSDVLYGGTDDGPVEADLLSFTGATGPLVLRFGNSLNSFLPGSSAEVLEDTVGSDFEGVIGADQFSNTFDGSQLSVLTFFLGGRQGDTLIGGTATDQLIGLGGNDVIYGGDGVDGLIGEGGDDDLFGGRGGDIFFVDGNDGHDTVHDLDVGPGGDLLFFTGSLVTDIRDLTFILVDADAGGAVNDTRITYSVGGVDSSVTFLNVDPETARRAIVLSVDEPAPQAVDQTLTGLEDNTLSMALDVNDPDDDPLTFTITDAPTNGTVSISATGIFTYTPDLDFSGSDSFAYEASDGLRTGSATVRLTILPVSDEIPLITETADLVSFALGLGAGETEVVLRQITLSDGQGGTVLRDVPVTLTGVNDAPEIQDAGSLFEASLVEDESVPFLTADGTILFT
ncbi:MAG: Ig-like domain-containing protein, partial [Paracoccaceae bacterium]